MSFQQHWLELQRMKEKLFFVVINSYSASHDNWCTATLWNRIMTARCEGMGEVGSARYEPALLPPCPSIRVLSYSNCQERDPLTPADGPGSVSVNICKSAIESSRFEHLILFCFSTSAMSLLYECINTVIAGRSACYTSWSFIVPRLCYIMCAEDINKNIERYRCSKARCTPGICSKFHM